MISNSKIDALTFLRFIAAIVVVWHHFGPAAGLSASYGLGPLMVTFFFVLSGFVLAITYLSRPHLDVRRFLVNRFSRITPVYYLALLLMVAGALVVGRRPDAVALALNLAFLQAWLPPYPLTINPPGWSLSVEAFLYLSFPFVSAVILRLSPKRALGLCAVVWLLTQVVNSCLLARPDYSDTGAIHDLIYYSPLAHWCSFLFGVAGGYWYLREGKDLRGRRGTGAAVLLAMLAVIVAVALAGHLTELFGAPLAPASSMLAPLFLSLVISVALAPDSVARALSLPAFVVLGNASYSLYILQMPVYSLYHAASGHDGPLDTPAHFFAFVLVLVVLSIAVYYLFERPAMRLLRSVAPTSSIKTSADALK